MGYIKKRKIYPYKEVKTSKVVGGESRKEQWSCIDHEESLQRPRTGRKQDHGKKKGSSTSCVWGVGEHELVKKKKVKFAEKKKRGKGEGKEGPKRSKLSREGTGTLRRC